MRFRCLYQKVSVLHMVSRLVLTFWLNTKRKLKKGEAHQSAVVSLLRVCCARLAICLLFAVECDRAGVHVHVISPDWDASFLQNPVIRQHFNLTINYRKW